MKKFISSNGQLFERLTNVVIDNKEMYHLGASIKDLGKNVLVLTKLKI